MEFDDDTTYTHFGFKENSKQARFFTQPSARGRIVGLLYEPVGEAPRSLVHASVVCRLFGSRDRDGSLELWHISVNPLHPLNNSERGTRWGVHNLISYNVNGKTRWTNTKGSNLTQRNARAHVRGTPNPYAIECLVRCIEDLNCPSVRQHDDMPCAQLFNTQYDQRTHPATMLIYEELRFRRTPGLSQYVWHRQFMPSLVQSYERFAQQMSVGILVVRVFVITRMQKEIWFDGRWMKDRGNFEPVFGMTEISTIPKYPPTFDTPDTSQSLMSPLSLLLAVLSLA